MSEGMLSWTAVGANQSTGQFPGPYQRLSKSLALPDKAINKSIIQGIIYAIHSSLQETKKFRE